MTKRDEACPTCGSSEHGCVVHDAGAFCYGPPRRAPAPPSSAPVIEHRFAVVRRRDADVSFRFNTKQEARTMASQTSKLTGESHGVWPTIEMQLPPEPPPPVSLGSIVTFAVPPSSPRVPCRRCGVEVCWISLPTGGRMAVTAETREAHDATCTGRRPAP